MISADERSNEPHFKQRDYSQWKPEAKEVGQVIIEISKQQGSEDRCITTRGVHKSGTDLVTSRMPGCFRDNALTPGIPRHADLI